MLLDLCFLGGPWSARQLHLAASIPGLTHACDSDMHHLADDVINGGRMAYEDGCMRVPEGPGHGVELDRDRVGRYAEAHQRLVAGKAHPFPPYPRW
jgi:glucarate dehydratase